MRSAYLGVVVVGLVCLVLSIAGCGGTSTGDGCGNLGEACCAPDSTCGQGSCVGDICRDCGGPGQACCAGGQCGDGETCTGGGVGICATCGGPGEVCCDLNTCGGGGCCVNDFCTNDGATCSFGGVCAEAKAAFRVVELRGRYAEVEYHAVNRQQVGVDEHPMQLAKRRANQAGARRRGRQSGSGCFDCRRVSQHCSKRRDV